MVSSSGSKPPSPPNTDPGGLGDHLRYHVLQLGCCHGREWNQWNQTIFANRVPLRGPMDSNKWKQTKATEDEECSSNEDEDEGKISTPYFSQKWPSSMTDHKIWRYNECIDDTILQMKPSWSLFFPGAGGGGGQCFSRLEQVPFTYTAFALSKLSAWSKVFPCLLSSLFLVIFRR